MFIDSVQPTNNISCKARLLYDPQTMEIVKRMACVAPLALWTALNLLERSPKKDTIALRCEQHYDTAKKTSSEFYSAQNVFTKAEILITEIHCIQCSNLNANLKPTFQSLGCIHHPKKQ